MTLNAYELEQAGVDPLDIAVHQTVHGFEGEAGRGVPALAKAMEVNAAVLQNQCNPFMEGHSTSLKRARSIMLTAGDYRILHQLAQDCGHVAFALPVTEAPADMDVLSSWAAWQLEIANTISRVQKALEDGKITMRELAKVEAELLGDYSKGLTLLATLKAMAEPDSTNANVVSIPRRLA